MQSDPAKYHCATVNEDAYKQGVIRAFNEYSGSSKDPQAKQKLKSSVEQAEKTYCDTVLGQDRTALSQVGRYFKCALANLSCTLLVPVFGIGAYLFVQQHHKTGSPLFFRDTASAQALKELDRDLLSQAGVVKA